MIEKNIQSEYVMDFLCRRQDGLGYREVKCTTVNNDLFIPADLKEFVKDNSPRAWKNLVARHGGDEDLVLRELMDEIKSRLEEASNVAVFFNRNRSITFQGESVQLVYVSGSELKGDEDFKKNIFSVSEEVSYTYKIDERKVYSIRPDISFFLNGIFLGYLELKSPFNGQSAVKEGRGKIVTDYMEAVQEYAKLSTGNDPSHELRREMLRIFENSIHLVATDVNETYVLRNVAQFCDELRKGFVDGTVSFTDYRPTILKVFKIYPVRNAEGSEKERFEEVMRALYSKQMIEKEILYYNFLQYEVEKRGRKKERKSNRGRLICPRPKQKFGCDKIVDRIQEFLDHEQEPDYFLEKLRRDLLAVGAGQEKVDKIVAQRAAYCNNKYVYSLLLQYAAGFGKSNIIGWTALQLKDLRYQGSWVYDKILLVVDRLQLRDQLDTMMMNMNIDKSMFVEATDSKTFIKALRDKRRIIVVNIQKFLDLRDSILASGQELRPMRVAFLIDEIHRSNTGASHEEMMNLFDELQDTFDSDRGKTLSSGGKKNLIIGFTATPSEKVLARFGEFSRSANFDPLWVPFDSYSMKEAIRDGYILDPTKHIISVPAKMYFEVPESGLIDTTDPDAFKKYGLRKQSVYENRDRMKAISAFIVRRLLDLVYGKIRGTGKAMLAVSSIPIAIDYCRMIRSMMRERTARERYARYREAPVAIVYSDNQDYPSCKSMNDGVSEEKVISGFKNAKNGLIIVVDKLQTGFDEPRLHTLFLDKEIRGINAIQTISRVDRVCKYKEECHIIDFSFNNENDANIKQAFLKYSDVVVSDFNPQAELKVVEELFKELNVHALYIKWFKDYVESKTDPARHVSVTMDMQNDFRVWIKDAISRHQEFTAAHPVEISAEGAEAFDEEGTDDARKLRSAIGQYGTKLGLLDGVLDISDAYKDADFIDFWTRYCMIYRDLIDKRTPALSIHSGYDGLIGLTVDAELEDPQEPYGSKPDESAKNGSRSSRKKKKNRGCDIIAMVRRLNDQAEVGAEAIAYWQGVTDKFFAFLQEGKEGERFVAEIKDEYIHFTREQIESDYAKLCRRFIRLHRSEDKLIAKFVDENAEHLLESFMEQVLHPDASLEVSTVDDESPQLLKPISRVASADLPARQVACGFQGEIVRIKPCNIPSDIELPFDSPLLNQNNSLYLTLRQNAFEQIVAGTKTIEYRDVRETTFKKYLVLDQGNPVPYDSETGKFLSKIPVPYDLYFYNNGKFPYLISDTINFLRFKAGATARDMDSLVVEVAFIKPVPQERFDLLKDGTEIKNPEGQFCEWILEFHLGRVRGVHRKKMDARRKG
ncbi:MAG: type I restriction enzyme subunit R domain-containing protein [Candidatus Cryptobacteroides sp.]|jgi:type I restriction enzyme R subunit